MKHKEHILIIGCGALAHEINEIIKLNDWNNVTLQCLNGDLRSRPEKRPAKSKETIESNRTGCAKVFLAFAEDFFLFIRVEI